MKVHCADKESCTQIFGNGGDCVNNTCICVDKSGCLKRSSRSMSTVTEIGVECTENEQCNIQNSACSDGKCTCKQDYVPSSDKRTCLQSKRRILLVSICFNEYFTIRLYQY